MILKDIEKSIKVLDKERPIPIKKNWLIKVMQKKQYQII